MLAVLTSFLHESFFNRMRTKQQLGYSVWAQDLGKSNEVDAWVCAVPGLIPFSFMVVLNGVHQLHLVIQSKKYRSFRLGQACWGVLRRVPKGSFACWLLRIWKLLSLPASLNIIRIPYNMHDEARKWTQSFVSKQYDLHNSVIDYGEVSSFSSSVHFGKCCYSFFQCSMWCYCKQVDCILWNSYLGWRSLSPQICLRGNIRRTCTSGVRSECKPEGVENKRGEYRKQRCFRSFKWLPRPAGIVSVEDRRLFRSQASYYPSMAETLRQRAWMKETSAVVWDESG